MRLCPSCGNPSISLLGLAVGRRPRCKVCGKSVGPHWIFAGVYACLLAAFVGFLGIYLLVNYAPAPSLMIMVAALMLINMAAARIAPLETKEVWWAP
jgi:uncharacterized protein (DUF983 family)